jgi:hypothetical protein
LPQLRRKKKIRKMQQLWGGHQLLHWLLKFEKRGWKTVLRYLIRRWYHHLPVWWTMCYAQGSRPFGTQEPYSINAMAWSAKQWRGEHRANGSIKLGLEL